MKRYRWALTACVPAYALAFALVEPAIAQQPQKQQVPRATTAPAPVEMFGPGTHRYTPKNAKLIRKTRPPTKVSPEQLAARKHFFPVGPTAVHAKLTPAAPVIAGKAGMNVFASLLFTTSAQMGPPQTYVHSEGAVSVDLRAVANKTYLFNVDVQSIGASDCKFSVGGPDAQVVEIPCASYGPQTLLFAFKTGPTVTGDVSWMFTIRSNGDFILYSVQIDTQ